MNKHSVELPNQTRTLPLDRPERLRIAVLIPCYNEEQSIAKVVRDFRAALGEATIYVYDNASDDRTAEIARQAGAVVRFEPIRGKGNVIRRMFADVDADVYVMVDGDDTYDAAAAPRLVERLLTDGLDLVTAVRIAEQGEAYRMGHRFGNRLLTGVVAQLFGDRFSDMLSGYRVFSRRFVKSFPTLAGGFEIETELTVHALELRMLLAEVPTPYRDRPQGSTSKLNTFRDGFRILWTILTLVREERPLPFFATIFVLLVSLSTGLALPLLLVYLETGLVPRFPTAILASATMVLAFLSLVCGLVLETVTRGRQEVKRLHYLAYGPPPKPAAIPQSDT
jgi:glycosyltransferase involved in cell wall biosynthesis